MIVESLTFNKQPLKLFFLSLIQPLLNYLALEDFSNLVLATRSGRKASCFDSSFLLVGADSSLVVFFHLNLFTLL